MKLIAETKHMRRIKICICVVIGGLALSGVTAFPLETELLWLTRHCAWAPDIMTTWLNNVYHAVASTNEKYPYLSYGTDWLAFAHLLLALLFIGPLNNPVKNVWVIQFGLAACILIFPLAFIAGGVRHIPLFWRLIDCSFGLFGGIPLFICYRGIKLLDAGGPLANGNG